MIVDHLKITCLKWKRKWNGIYITSLLEWSSVITFLGGGTYLLLTTGYYQLEEWVSLSYKACLFMIFFLIRSMSLLVLESFFMLNIWQLDPDKTTLALIDSLWPTSLALEMRSQPSIYQKYTSYSFFSDQSYQSVFFPTSSSQLNTSRQTPLAQGVTNMTY